MIPTTLNLTFHSDPGHGWLEVPEMFIPIHLWTRISFFSYKKDKKVFLEEDCDAPLFLSEMERQGVIVKISNQEYAENCFIRDMRRFKAIN